MKFSLLFMRQSHLNIIPPFSHFMHIAFYHLAPTRQFLLMDAHSYFNFLYLHMLIRARSQIQVLGLTGRGIYWQNLTIKYIPCI